MGELNAIVTQRIDFAPGLMILRVAPEGWELPDFSPGQFAVLGLPPAAPRCKGSIPDNTLENALSSDAFICRPYSIASSSQDKAYLEFYIVLVGSGQLTPRLFALGVGDRLFLGQKITGLFTLEPVAQGQHCVFVATGTGLAPYMSMIRTHLEAAEPRKFAILHGARNSWDLGYRQELFQMQRLTANFRYYPVVTEPAAEPIPWTGHTGFVQQLWTDGVITQAWGIKPAPENTHIFLCGNPHMIRIMKDLLHAEGFKDHSRQEPGQIHVEEFCLTAF